MSKQFKRFEIASWPSCKTLQHSSWCNENYPLYYHAGLSFCLTGRAIIQDVNTSNDVNAVLRIWTDCVNEARKKNKGFAWMVCCGGGGRKIDLQHIEMSILFGTLQTRRYRKRSDSSELQRAEIFPAQTQLFDRESCWNSHESPAQRLPLSCEISFFCWPKEIDVANSWQSRINLQRHHSCVAALGLTLSATAANARSRLDLYFRESINLRATRGAHRRLLRLNCTTCFARKKWYNLSGYWWDELAIKQSARIKEVPKSRLGPFRSLGIRPGRQSCCSLSWFAKRRGVKGGGVW